jgi:DNA polymerase-3 subunit delta'
VSAEESERIEPAPPRETTGLFGHAHAEQALLAAYQGTRFPHAWLIAGPAGIGKATLAYRMARFMLALPDPRAPQVQSAKSLHVDRDHPVARRIAAQAQGDLLVLERTINEKTGKLRQDIQVDDVRRTVAFFGSTAGEGGWRIAIVDAVDNLNPSGANALLKILEEPPRRAVLLLVSRSAARVLPTMRSRCRVLALRPLAAADVARAVAAASGGRPDAPDIVGASAAADGSVGRALALLEGDALELYGVDPAPLATFVDTVNAWLSARLAAGAQAPARLAGLAEAWEKVNAAARDVEEYNLERRPLVFNVFGWLAEASRG